MNIPEDKKIDVLISVQNNRLTQVDGVRNRVFQLITWMSAVFVLLSGYIIQKSIEMSVAQKIGVTLSVLICALLIIWQLRDMNRGYKLQLTLLAKADDLLKLYTEGIYGDESVLPKSWLNNPGSGILFRFAYTVLGLITLLTISIIWFQGIFFNSK